MLASRLYKNLTISLATLRLFFSLSLLRHLVNGVWTDQSKQKRHWEEGAGFTWTKETTSMGNMDMGKRSKLKSVNETKALLASSTWFGSLRT